ncbi:hypothetical protein M5K25_022043 [Dendrobium thyrsiflorum]|uniref:Uncharacterized protein n=1 Tax=Dendrobium thyrsiflorum TaxID=117978 RepID=A0ABD0U5F1_DENTH
MPGDLHAYLNLNFVPSTIQTPNVPQHNIVVEEQHVLRERPLQPPQYYTSGSDALPHRPCRSQIHF